ncbi:hypothetical protein [Nocardioides sp. KR10-350]|uniref:hypothetical protein n=1 Tax=Nocardioides cheoyonin TaxID=3156615 RepID=UPI0032B53C59
MAARAARTASRSASRTASRTGEIEQLRARLQRLERSLTGREIETHPVLSGLVQLRAGGAYSVDGMALAMALLAGPSRAGEWCAVVGADDFGAEAAAELGINLDRTILVPEPRESWLEATAALIDVTTLVAVRPPARVPASVADKLAARLRTRGAALVALCDRGAEWPRAEVRLSTAGPQWSGAGRGEGHLRSRRLEVEVRRGAAPARRTSVWFPADDGEVRPARRAYAAVPELADEVPFGEAREAG